MKSIKVASKKVTAVVLANTSDYPRGIPENIYVILFIVAVREGENMSLKFLKTIGNVFQTWQTFSIH